MSYSNSHEEDEVELKDTELSSSHSAHELSSSHSAHELLLPEPSVGMQATGLVKKFKVNQIPIYLILTI